MFAPFESNDTRIFLHCFYHEDPPAEAPSPRIGPVSDPAEIKRIGWAITAGEMSLRGTILQTYLRL